MRGESRELPAEWDAGRGSGHRTAELLEFLPQGHVIVVDRSASMLAEAATNLNRRFGTRSSFLQCALQNLDLPEKVDAIFSTATFRWIRNQPQRFWTLFDSLKPGGCLVVQSRGGPTMARLRSRAEALLPLAKYQEKATGGMKLWEFATPGKTALRLAAAGFTGIETHLSPTPTTFPSAVEFSEFVRSVVLCAHLNALPGKFTRDAIVAGITAMASKDEPTFTLDYWCLTLSATHPGSS